MKLHKRLFYLLIILLPLNLSKHFIQGENYISGILVDYLIPNIYLTDIIIILLLASWLVLFPKVKFNPRSFWIALAAFLSLSFASIFLASLKGPAVFKFLRLLELSLLTLYTANQISFKKEKERVIFLLLIPFVFESLLGVAQFVRQGSIFGFIPFGEQVFGSGTPQIAKASFFGVLKVLPYATFTHPNVLGGFLSILIPLVGPLFGILGFLALLLTRSNVALISLVVGVLAGRKKTFGIALLAVLIYLFPLNLVSNSLSQRIDLASVSLSMVKSSPLFGIGLNNFTVQLYNFGGVSGLVRFLQPVHNIFLLTASESGVPALISLITLLIIAFKTASFKFKILLIQLMILGFFDHYLLTVQQGLLMFFLILGLLLAQANGVSSE